MQTNILYTFFLCFICTTIYSQKEYFSTNGKDRITKTELFKKIEKKQNYISSSSGIEHIGTYIIDNTEIISDSIIKHVYIGVKKYESIDERHKKTPIAKYLNKQLPKFDLKTINGKKITFDELRGKPTLINFWFTRCPPCIEEMPILNKLYNKYKNEVNFISITYETKDHTEHFFKKHKFDFKHIINANDFIDSLGINRYPTNIFLDKDGRLTNVMGGIPYSRNKNGDLEINQDPIEMSYIIEKLK
ncbi:hypothetical protein MHTCC0001_12650 [Flavobacteriaceae bacterium MHTCC 0001]